MIASTNLTAIAAGARIIYFVNGEITVQNGSPDGIALINVPAQAIMDAFCYEGAMTAAQINGFPGASDLVEGTALPSATADSNTNGGSLARLPNGQDSGNASADWQFTPTLTPGAPNLP